MTNNIAVAIFAVLIVVLIGCQQTTNTGNIVAETDNKITIGAILPLTGPVASYGIPSQESAIIAVDEINQIGGINGKMLKVDWQDGQCNPKTAFTIAQSFNHNNIKVILGGLCSGETLGMAPFTEENKMLVLTPVSTSEKVSFAGDYVFRTAPSDRNGAEQVAELIFKKSISSIGIIVKNSDFTIDWASTFSKRFSELGGSVLGEEVFDTEMTGMRTQMLKIDTKDVDAILLLPQSPSEACSLAKNAKELGIKKQLFGNQIFALGSTISGCEEDVNGVVLAKYKYSTESEGFKEFNRKYEQLYGKQNPAIDPSLTYYDAVYLLADGLKVCSDDADCLKEFLYDVSAWKGVSGDITFDENGDVDKEFELRMIKDGEMVSVE